MEIFITTSLFVFRVCSEEEDGRVFRVVDSTERKDDTVAVEGLENDVAVGYFRGERWVAPERKMDL